MILAQVRVLLTLGIAFVALGAAAYHEAGNSVFAEAASKQLGAGNLKAIFPQYATSLAKFRGFLG